MLADEICYLLWKGAMARGNDNQLVFWMTASDAVRTEGLLYQWAENREGYSEWVQDGDHWDHKHPDGIKFHHPSKGCEDFI